MGSLRLLKETRPATGTADGLRQKQLRAIADLKEIRMAVQLFYLQHSRLPSGLAEIAGEFRGNRVPKDPWGREYVFKATGRALFDLHCLGADGKPGGEGAARDLFHKSKPDK
jgi:hypothetical protein